VPHFQLDNYSFTDPAFVLLQGNIDSQRDDDDDDDDDACLSGLSAAVKRLGCQAELAEWLTHSFPYVHFIHACHDLLSMLLQKNNFSAWFYSGQPHELVVAYVKPLSLWINFCIVQFPLSLTN